MWKRPLHFQSIYYIHFTSFLRPIFPSAYFCSKFIPNKFKRNGVIK